MNKHHFYVSIVSESEFHVIKIWNRDRKGAVIAKCQDERIAEQICNLLNQEQHEREREFLASAKAT